MVVGLAADGDVDLTSTSTSPTDRSCSSSAPRATACPGSSTETCDQLVSIPMVNQVESLNAGVAASVALYAVACARA